MDEAHERQEATVRPAVDCNTTQVHKLVLVSYVVQTLHLVINLHLPLFGGEQRGELPGMGTLSLTTWMQLLIQVYKVKLNCVSKLIHFIL